MRDALQTGKLISDQAGFIHAVTEEKDNDGGQSGRERRDDDNNVHSGSDAARPRHVALRML